MAVYEFILEYTNRLSWIRVFVLLFVAFSACLHRMIPIGKMVRAGGIEPPNDPGPKPGALPFCYARK